MTSELLAMILIVIGIDALTNIFILMLFDKKLR